MVGQLDGGTQKQLSRTDRQSKRRVDEQYADEYRGRPDLMGAFQASQETQERDWKRVKGPKVASSSQPEREPPSYPSIHRAVSSSDTGLLQRVDQQRHSINGGAGGPSVLPPRNGGAVRPTALPPPIPKFDRDAELLRRAGSLVRKSEMLVGGPRFTNKATDFDELSPRHPDAQERIAQARWNYKLIGVYPFLKAMDGGAAFIAGLDPRRSDRENYEAIEKWIGEHRREARAVREVLICGFSQANVPEFRSLFYDLGGKVYNYIPQPVCQFTGLRRLLLVNNHLNLASFPKEMGDLPLQKLDLSFNKLEAIPECVARMALLEEFSVASNRERIALPDDSPLWSARNLIRVDLSSIEMESLSPSVGNLTRLENLDLRSNRLRGLPDSLSRLVRLKAVILNDNQFSSFPEVLQSLPSLEVLQLLRNRHFHFADITAFIRGLIQKERVRVDIHLDGKYLKDRRYASLIEEVEAEGGYLLALERHGDHTLIKLRKILDPGDTQEID